MSQQQQSPVESSSQQQSAGQAASERPLSSQVQQLQPSTTAAEQHDRTPKSVSIAEQPAINIHRTTAATAISSIGEADSEDAELQAALALSLQQCGAGGVSSSSSSRGGEGLAMNNIYPDNSSTTVRAPRAATSDSAPSLSSVDDTTRTNALLSLSSTLSLHPWSDAERQDLLQSVQASVAPFPTSDFSRIMWDDLSTTDADKQRWVSQGIDTRAAVLPQSDHNSTAGTTTTNTTTTSSSSNTDDSSSNMNTESTTAAAATTTTTESGEIAMLDWVASSHAPWGLEQQHGGPCGVLAAVQAELLRHLLFGASSSNTATIDPTLISTTLSHNNSHTVAQATVPSVTVGLARAVAVVLARAALTPSAVDETTDAATTATSTATAANTESMVARVVLPADRERELSWNDLEGGHSSQAEAIPALNVYRIPLPTVSPTTVSPTTVQQEDDEELGSRPTDTAGATAPASSDSTRKRQKMQAHNNESLSDRILRLAMGIEAFLLHTTDDDDKDAATRMAPSLASCPLDCFRRPGGVLLLVMSLTASRTVEAVVREFDDPQSTRLTAQFGHCGQELMNLLLTGQAVSNVFDNTLSPSGDICCRGIQSRPWIGYLTQLEAMRYCEVGGYYKSPLFPIWVVGSTSHFTVLFGDPKALKESDSDKLLDECRRAFKAVEGGEENGFIKTEQLGEVLKSLSIFLGTEANSDDETSRIQTLAASIEVSGASIILWDDFWKVASRLLTGASLETVLQGEEGTTSSFPINMLETDETVTEQTAQPPPLMLMEYAHNSDFASAKKGETDEEMARRLGSEWGSGDGMSALTNAASAASPMDVDNANISDEEMARKLQAMFDSEGNSRGMTGGSSVAATNGSPILDIDDVSTIPATPTHGLDTVEENEYVEDAKPAAIPMGPSKNETTNTATSQQQLLFEKYGDSFSLYHYNGMRGGLLTPFRITRLTAEEAVGASIALNQGTSSSHGTGGGDLEDVVRTKWPSCAVNWLGKQPPYID